MLSAFIARPTIELKQRDKSKIECILAFGDRVLVGLSTGCLRIYRLNEVPEDADSAAQDAAASAPKTRAADLLREEEKFSRRPIQQLAVIKEAGILVSLSDNYVSFYDLHKYELQERLDRTRGATAFAVTSNIVKDNKTGIPSIVSRLAVAVKRKVIFWLWQDMELAAGMTEISLAAAVKSLTWFTSTKIAAGMDPGFVLVDVNTQDVVDVHRTGALGDGSGQGTRFAAVSAGYMGMGSWVPKPMATRLGDSEMLLAKDVHSLFVDAGGKALDKRQVPWPTAPETVAYSYPYMLALQSPSKGALEVRNPDTLNLLQSVALPNASLLHVPQPNISLAHAGKGFFVASDRCIWRMSALSYDSQINELVTSGRFDEAVSLLSMLEDTLLRDKEGRMREIKMLKARSLFGLHRYREAMELFSEARAPPERVILLYPRSVAGELSTVEASKYSDEADQGIEGDAMSDTPMTPPLFAGRSMIGRLMEGKKDADAASMKSCKADDASDEDSVRGKTDASQSNSRLQGRDLKTAVHELRAFLAQSRVQLKRYLTTNGTLKEPLPEPGDSQAGSSRPPFYHFISETGPGSVNWVAQLVRVAQLVDTTLFRAYMLVSPSLAGPLFRLDNFCDPDVVNEKLYETGRYTDLIDFLHGKRRHRQALELLAKFGKNEAEEQVALALLGPQRTIGYLQQLPPDMIDLILEFAKWPLQEAPELGMEVFVADTENAETLPRDRVLDFLQDIDPLLAVQYLEHIIEELNDLTPDFHQRLIELHLARLKEGAFSSDKEHRSWSHRFQTFLKKSTQYNKVRVFKELPVEDAAFLEARAIVLSKMGQHKQALQIYVFQLHSFQKAEEYCNEVYLAAAASNSTSGGDAHTSPQTMSAADVDLQTPSVYHTLLSLYLAPPAPHTARLAPALDLLSRHGARLPAAMTLDLVPAVVAVQALEAYFRGRMRAAHARLAEDRVAARLRGVRAVDVHARLALAARARAVIVGPDRHCRVCGKRFGGAAIRVYPDGGVVHSGCSKGSGNAAISLAAAGR